MLKRIFDIVFSSIAILLVLPLFVPIIIILRFTGEGKVFYKQTRVGVDKKPFDLLKFSTMLENSSNMQGGDVTSANDPRVLPVGKILRKTKINELPQFFNILKGDMSLVGPRPTTVKNYSYYSEKTQLSIKHLKPGLTGVGSIIFRDEESFIKNASISPIEYYKNEIAPFKGELELWYSQKQNFLVDTILVFITLIVVIVPSSKILNKTFTDLPKHNVFNP